MSAADQLQGLTLDGGWQVIQQMSQQPSSGGFHSVPYLVKDAQGKEHFLKAFDFSRAFEPGRDVIHELQLLTSVYENERDILEHCKRRRLSRVVVAVTFGYVQVSTMPGPSGTVYYLIFELAESDVRRQVDLKTRLDCLTCLKILDDVTLGMMQIHNEAIAHQDLKPSNVLIYGKDGSRLLILAGHLVVGMKSGSRILRSRVTTPMPRQSNFIPTFIRTSLLVEWAATCISSET
jgi:eukaryotic-like serine/threonine-protein kinase